MAREASGDGGDRASAALADALDVPVVWWADLPIPASLELRVGGRPLWLTASRRRRQEARRVGQACLGPSEYEAASCGLVEGRAGRPDVARWVQSSATRPGWVLAPVDAVAGAVGLLDARGRARPPASMRMRDLLALLEAEFVQVWLELPDGAAVPELDVEGM